MFKLRERDGLPQPYRCPKPSDWHQFFTCKLQSGNSKETFAKFVARTHRERSAQRDAITVPRHRSYTPFKICRDRRVVCPEKKVGHPRAGLAGRARAASGHLVSAGCCRATLRVFSPGESPSPHTLASGRPERERVVKSARRSRDTPRAGFHARARRGRQQDRAGQAQEGPDERVDGPLRLCRENKSRYLRLFGDRGLRHELAAQVDGHFVEIQADSW